LKRKFFSVFFALVLVLSMSLVTAVPVGAEVESLTLTMPANVYQPETFTLSSTCTNGTIAYDSVRFEFTLDGRGDFDSGTTLADIFSITAAESDFTGSFADVTSIITGGLTGSIEGGNIVAYWNEAGFEMSDGYDVTTHLTFQMTSSAPPGSYIFTFKLVDLTPDPDEPLATATGDFSLSDDTLYVGTTEYEYQFNTIQSAISVASADDTINVAAGIYDEQVVIEKSLTLQGAGDTTIIQPTQATVTDSFQLFSRRIPGHAQGDGPTAAIVVVSGVNGSDSATIKDIKIDALNVGSSPAGASKFVEMLSTGSNAILDGVTFLGNDEWPDDALYLTPWDQTAVTVEVKNCSFSRFWFNAITANFTGLTANIHHNIITGRGEVTDSAGNGIQYGWGCTGTASYNTISNLAYISGSVYVDAGIQFWCTNATASHNTITDCQTGVMVQANEAGTFTATVENNTISAPGLSATPRDIEGINVSANANNPSITATIQGNDLSGGGLGDGIGIGLTEGGDSPDVTADINGNEISGWNNGIWLGGSTKTVNITHNTIASNDVNGIDVLTGVDVSNVSANSNDICGNENFGIQNLGTGTLDAELNWWGAATGADHATNPHGAGQGGDVVSDNVDFTPWYATATTTPLTQNVSVEHPGSSIIAYSDTIQGGIDAALAGDTVTVATGTYQEDITIDEEVTLQGAGKTTTTINRDTATSAVVLITANNVTITGFKIDGGSSPYQCSNLVNVSWTTSALENIEVSDCHLLHCKGAAIWINGDPDAAWAQGTGYTINDNLIEYFAGDACTTGGCQYRGIAVGKTLGLEIKRNTITNSNLWEYNSDNFTYGGYAIYLKDYTGGTVEENIISKCLYGIVVNSNVEETFVNNNTITECHRGIATGESFAKIHITNNSITTRRDPGIPVHPKNINEQGILLGGDGDQYDSSPGYAYEVDDLQHEVSGNTVTGTATTDSFGLGVMPGWWDKDYGASGTFTNNTVSGYKYGIKVWGTYAPWGGSTEDMTSQVNVSFNYNDIVSCTIGATTDTIWSGTVDATKNYWGDISGPEHEATNPGGTGNAVSDNVEYIPWLTRDFQTVLDDNIAYFGFPMVQLNTGWNTFSTPVALDSACDEWDEYVALGDGLNIHGTSPAYAYDPTVPGGWVPLIGEDDDYRLKPCDAIYVRMAEPDIAAILYSPEPTVPTKDVYQGWNLVGLASLDPMFANNALTSLYMVTSDLTGYSVVISPPLAQSPWTLVRGGSPQIMQPTRGYWVFMENGPDTLAGFTFTPFSLEVPSEVLSPGLWEVPFEWYSMTTGSADAYGADDDGNFTITLPWSFPFAGKEIVSIGISSNGYIELLESGETYSYDDSSYDTMEIFVNDENPDGDFIFAWFDDLESSSYGFYGVEDIGDVVVVHWETPTYNDEDEYHSPDYMNYFQLWLFPDGSIQWNFGEFNYDLFGYGLGTGIYESDSGILLDVANAMGEPDGIFNTPEKSYRYFGQYWP